MKKIRELDTGDISMAAILIGVVAFGLSTSNFGSHGAVLVPSSFSSQSTTPITLTTAGFRNVTFGIISGRIGNSVACQASYTYEWGLQVSGPVSLRIFDVTSQTSISPTFLLDNNIGINARDTSSITAGGNLTSPNDTFAFQASNAIGNFRLDAYSLTCFRID